jgi:hypothetical protein
MFSFYKVQAQEHTILRIARPLRASLNLHKVLKKGGIRHFPASRNPPSSIHQKSNIGILRVS